MHGFFLSFLITAGALAAIGSVRAQETVSREAPAGYEAVRQLLTPLDEILANAPDKNPNSEDSSRLLLREEIHFLEPGGRRLIVDHQVMRAETESGVNDIAQMEYAYAKDLQRVHLVQAQTIAPNGTKTTVREDAAFLSSPQYQAAMGIYDDVGILTVIFPQVQAGSITQSILVYEQSKSRIPGEFRDAFTIRAYMPQDRVRWVLEAPNEIAEAIQFVEVGPEAKSGVVKDEDAAEGRTRWVFETERPRKLAFEPRAPRPEQLSAIWATTFEDWDEIGKWYAGLAAGRDELGDALKAKLDEWAPEDLSREETIARLLSEVANTIRYTGLEFGIAALQPRDCNEVFEAGYGDCKDKSNLLRALLAARGIESRLVLIDTEFGKAVRQAPDYRQFNHCILAIVEDDGWSFCDPTVEGAKLNQLPQTDRGRDVLVIREDGADWVTTPADANDKVAYKFELEVDHSGRISGWVDVEAHGYMAGVYRFSFSGKTPEEQRELGQMLVAAMIVPGALTPDITLPDAEEEDADVFKMRAFLVSGGGQMGQMNQTTAGGPFLNLSFPASPNQGFLGFEGKPRENPFPLHSSAQHYEGTVKIPEGMQPSRLPSPFKSKNEWITMEASWEYEEGVCAAKLSLVSKSGVLSPSQFEEFRQSRTGFQRWIQNPIVLLSTKRSDPTLRPMVEQLENFPTLSNGQSQLYLVDSLYPEGGNMQLRRAALHRTATLFPDDRLTAFRVGVALASLDSETDPKAGVARIEPLLSSFKADVPEDEFAGARYTLGLCLEGVEGRMDEAIGIYKEVAADESLEAETRSLAAFRGGYVARTEERGADTFVAELEGALDLESMMSPYIFGEWAVAKLQLDQGRDVLAKLEALFKSDNPLLAFNALDGIEAYAASPEISNREELGTVLRGLGSESGNAAIDERVAAILEMLSENVDAVQIAVELQKFLREEGQTRFPNLVGAVNPAFQLSNRDLARGQVSEFEASRQPLLSAQLAVAILTRFDADESTNLDVLTAAYHVNWLADQGSSGDEIENLLDRLLGALTTFPEGSDFWHEGFYIECYADIRRGDPAAAREKMEEALESPNFQPLQIDAGRFLVGRAAEAAGDVDVALKIYGDLVRAEWSVHKFEGLARGAYLAFHADQADTAAHFIQELGAAPQEIVLVSELQTMVRDLIEMVANDQHEAYWKYTETWWDKWKALEGQLKLTPADSLLDVPTLPNSLVELGQLQMMLTQPDRTLYHDVLRRLVVAAKFNPGVTTDLYQQLQMVTQLRVLTPTARRAFLELIVAVGEDPPLPGALLRQQGMVLAANCALQLGDREKARELLDAFDAENKNPAEMMLEIRLSAAMTRGGLAAIEDKGHEEAAADLRQLLEQSDVLPERFAVITVLIGLYEKIDDRDTLVATLEREINHPAIRSNQVFVTSIQRELGKYKMSAEDAAEFDAFVADWLKKHRPPWYDYAKPKDLAAAKKWREDQLEAAKQRPGALQGLGSLPIPNLPSLGVEDDTPAAEGIKANLLFAQDPQSELFEREEAFLGAALQIADKIGDEEARREIYKELLSLDSISLTQRETAARNAIRASFLDAEFRDFIVTLPGGASQKRMVEMLKERAESNPLLAGDKEDQKTAEELTKEINETLADDRLDVDELQQFSALFQRMIQAGAFDEAEEVASKLKDVSLPPQAGTSTSRMRLFMRRAIAEGRKTSGFYTKVRERVLVLFPERPEVKSKLKETPGPLYDFSYFRDNSHQEIVDMLVADIHDGKHNNWPLPFWSMLLHNLTASRNPDRQLLSGDLYRLGLEEDTPGPRSEFRIWAAHHEAAFDADEPSLRERAKAIVEEFKDEAWIDQQTKISLLQLLASVRHYSGENEILTTEELNSGGPELHFEVRDLIFENHAILSDNATLRSVLESRDLDELMEDHLVLYTLHAYRRLGMELEIELIEEDLTERLYGHILESWTDSSKVADADIAIDIASALPGGIDVFPNGYLESLERIKSSNPRCEVLAKVAQLQENWERVAEVSKEGMEANPTYVIHHWHRAKAAYHLNDFDTARPLLEHLTDRSHGRIWHAEVIDLLEKVKQ